ncbi:MAG: hypothetical protein J1E36_04370, partial [Eubacterium sp.]|nr:hypothetical protein [Eubacterium sp.]
MKTKFSKRILSAFLSILMVVTTIPAFAIVAKADPSPTGLVGSYLSKDATTGIDKSRSVGNVTWDANEHAAYFDGNSYIVLEGAPMASVTASTGFAISFDYKRSADNPDNGRILDFNSGSDYNSFAINGGTPNQNEWRRLMTLAKVNGVESSYYANDFGNTDYCTWQGTAFPPEEQADTWYNVTVSMAPSGEYSYYINGVLRGTFRSNYNIHGVSNGVVPTTISDSFTTFNNYMIGKAIYSTDPGFKGYVKNVKLYDRPVNATQAFAGDASSDIATLKGAIDEYESRMDGTIYTNMGPAYNAYVEACKAYDSYYYGGNTSVDIVTPAAKLATEAYKMHAYIAPTVTANAVPTFPTSSQSDMAGYAGEGFNNVLYASQAVAVTESTPVTGDKMTHRMYYASDAVLLYDGSNKVLLPVMVSAQLSQNKTRYIWSAYPSDSSQNDDPNWCFDQAWRSGNGQDANWNWNWWSNSSSAGYNNATGRHGVYSTSMRTGEIGNGKTRYLSNVLRLKTAPTAYGQSYILTWFVSTGGDNNNDYSIKEASYPIRVVNYTTFTNAFATFKAKMNGLKVSAYKEGGLSSYFSAMDQATAFNLNSYFSSGEKYDACISDMQTVVTAMNSATLTEDTEDTKDNYPALRDAFEYESKLNGVPGNAIYSVRGAYNNGVRKGYTSSTWNSFKDAYVTAMKVMSPVANDGYKNGAGAAAAAKELIRLFLLLEAVDISVPTFSVKSGSYLGPNDEITIETTENNAVITYTIEYNDGPEVKKSTVKGDKDVTFAPFDGKNTYTSVTVSAYVEVDGDKSLGTSATYTFLKAPSFSTKNGTFINSNGTVSITSNSGVEGTIRYRIGDKGGFEDYTGPITPFDFTYQTDIHIYAYERYTNADGTTGRSEIVNILLIMNATFGIYSDCELGDEFIDSKSTIFMGPLDTYGTEEQDGQKIKYTLTIDGVPYPEIFEYNEETGIIVANYDILLNAKIVKIYAYPESNTDTEYEHSVTAIFYNGDNYSPLAYQESFTGASVSGNTFTSGTTGINGTINGSAQVVSGAGTVDGNGNSPDWRNDVFSAYQKNKLTLESNPLAGENGEIAQQAGATISFWRHIENASGNTVNTGDNLWTGAITFKNPNIGGNYFMISTNGWTSFHPGTADGYYKDVNPDKQDLT